VNQKPGNSLQSSINSSYGSTLSSYGSTLLKLYSPLGQIEKQNNKQTYIVSYKVYPNNDTDKES